MGWKLYIRKCYTKASYKHKEGCCEKVNTEQLADLVNQIMAAMKGKN